MAGRLATARAGRRAALLALVAAVVAMHGCVGSALGDRFAELHAAQDAPARIDVAYVRELAPVAPPAVAPVPAAPPTPPAVRAPRAPVAVAPAASAVPNDTPAEPPSGASEPAPAASAPAEVAELPVASADPPPPASATASDAAPETVAAAPLPAEIPAAAAPAAATAVPAPASAAGLAANAADVAASGAAPADIGALAFDWPVSTRLSYNLTGYYRGEVAGSAQVEWVRSGARYQVHLDIGIGPSLAPLITRRMSSDGEITAEGLAPRRYDEETKVVFRDRQRRTLLFDADSVVLSNGDRRPRTPGTQDSASQFVQLTWLFTTRPELLRPGASVEIPLALPRRVERWTYDVLDAEPLTTPIGELPTFHLKPRREVAKAGGDLIAEIWYAPSLRYLPVRIRIQQDAETFLDLTISRKPELAGP